jgi:hypothetical protein
VYIPLFLCFFCFTDLTTSQREPSPVAAPKPRPRPLGPRASKSHRHNTGTTEDIYADNEDEAPVYVPSFLQAFRFADLTSQRDPSHAQHPKPQARPLVPQASESNKSNRQDIQDSSKNDGANTRDSENGMDGDADRDPEAVEREAHRHRILQEVESKAEAAKRKRASQPQTPNQHSHDSLPVCSPSFLLLLAHQLGNSMTKTSSSF